MTIYNRNLKFLRKRKNRTQAEVARDLGLPRSTVNGYENMPLNPTVKNLVALSEYYGISIDHLLRTDLTLLKKDELMELLTGKIETV